MKFGHTTLAATTLLTISPAAFAQAQQQTLSVAFVNFNAVVPLSDWLTAAMALLLAASAVVVLRRQSGRAGRLFGALLALVAGTTLFTATGQRVVSEAQAFISPAINLVVSPSSLVVTPFVPSSPLTVTVTNNSGQSARITGISLDSGAVGVAVPGKAIVAFYSIDPSSQCQVGTTLSPLNACTITLILAES